MIRALFVAIITSLLFIGLVEAVRFIKSQNAYAIIPGSCPHMDFLWAHTYGAGPNHWSHNQKHSRLTELHPECVVFDGVVRGAPADEEHDGDMSFNVTPDTQDDKDLLNMNNTKALNGALHVEIICMDKKAIDPSYFKTFNGDFCKDVDPPFPLPQKGEHVRITGKWVKDVGSPHPDHEEWNEIHPVESIQVLHP